MRIAVAGGGYVGLATAVGFAARGHDVELIDIDPARAAALRAGRLPFDEPSLAAPLRQVIGRSLRVHESYGTLGHVDFAFVCVDTNPGPDGALDCDRVLGATRDLLTSCDDPTVVVRSTVNPGTTLAVEQELRAEYPSLRMLCNPEFLREGTAFADFENPARRVIGGSDEAAIEALASLYRFSPAAIMLTDATSAELMKLAANAALAVRVSLANEVASIADACGADADFVLASVGADPRLGAGHFQPGIGFGGSCLPKDLDALRASARRRELSTPVLDGGVTTNELAIDRVARRACDLADDPRETPVCVVGVGFKPGSDSVRASRPLALVRELLAQGFPVSIYDPLAEPGARRELGDGVRYLRDAEAIGEHEIIIVPHGVDAAAVELSHDAALIDGRGRLLRGLRAPQRRPDRSRAQAVAS
jgi:UDPglucose 6-dehydrogenase